MKKRVLLTGSNGFIGQKLLEKLLEEDTFNVLAFSKGGNRYINPQGYQYINGDVCDEVQLKSVFLDFKPDIVIHTVALANVETCEKDVEECRKVNVDPIKTFVVLAEEYNFHFIQLSTDFIFDGEDGPYAEEALPNPLNEYGKSKLEAERLLQNSEMRWSVIRTILVYGKPHEITRSNVILWVKNSLEQGKEIQVVTNHYRMPTLVEDLVDATVTIIQNEKTGVYHICGNELLSVYEIAQEVASFWKLDASLIKPVHSNAFPAGTPRPENSGFVLDKAIRELDYKSRSLTDGFALMEQQLKMT